MSFIAVGHHPTRALALSGKPPMPRAFRQLAKITPADVDEVGMVAAFEIKLALLGQTVVDNDIEPISSGERGYRTRFAVDKQRLDLLFARNVDIVAEQLSRMKRSATPLPSGSRT